MWPFSSKKNLEESLILQGFTDWHCHLLPGVDDGVQQIDETLDLLAEYERMGVKEVWFTPHVMEDVPNDPEKLRARFDEVLVRYKGGINLNLAAENMLDNLFDERLEQGKILPIGKKGDHLLVETSYFTPPSDMTDKLKRVRSQGLFPLLAHPERYVYMDEMDYARLNASGIKFQLNLYSLFGMYGPEVRDKARMLLKKGFYHAIGSDTHRMRQLQFASTKGGIAKKDIQSLIALRDSIEI